MKIEKRDVILAEIGDRVFTPDGAGTVTAVDEYLRERLGVNCFEEQEVTVKLKHPNRKEEIEIDARHIHLLTEEEYEKE